MRVIRSVVMVMLFLVGVFVANANMHTVDVTYLPSAPALGLPVGATITVPLFLVVLVTLAVGVLLGGLVAILEQAQLRLGLRRARKERDRAVEEQAKATALLENANSDAAGLRAELAELRAELRAAGESVKADEPLSPFLDPDDSCDPEISSEASPAATSAESDQPPPVVSASVSVTEPLPPAQDEKKNPS